MTRLGFVRVGLGVAAVAGALVAACTSSTLAASPPVGNPRTLVLFNIDIGQLPENMYPGPNGTLIVALNGAHEVAQIGTRGQIKVLATLPAPADGGVNTPVVKTAFLAGIVRAANGDIYVLYSTGTQGQTGIWRITPGGTPALIVPLPATSLANGLALDAATHKLYVADSTGIIWQAPQAGGTASVWASGPQFKPEFFLGANGLKIHDNAVWVSNTDAGTILRIPIAAGGTAGAVTVAASGLATIDDFNFAGSGNEIFAALDKANEVALVKPNGTHTIVLDPSDGLEGPTSIIVRSGKIYVASAGYNTGENPNILVAPLS